jgi:hypothetical protein
MGPKDRRNTRTTEAVRASFRESRLSLKVLAAQCGVNPKTVAKWRKRQCLADLPPGPKTGLSRRLTSQEEELIVRFRKYTLLPLDDCLYALQARIPHLTRSTLHRCLQRYGVSRMSASELSASGSQSLDLGRFGQLEVDIAEVQSGEGPHYFFNAIEQVSKSVFVQMRPGSETSDALQFLDALIAHFPCRINRIVTLGAEAFVLPSARSAFQVACAERGILHELAEWPSPWSEGSVGGIKHAVRDVATFSSEAYLAELLREFTHAYNFCRRLKRLGGKTPHGVLCEVWRREPGLFHRDPHHGTMRQDI